MFCHLKQRFSLDFRGCVLTLVENMNQYTQANPSIPAKDQHVNPIPIFTDIRHMLDPCYKVVQIVPIQSSSERYSAMLLRKQTVHLIITLSNRRFGYCYFVLCVVRSVGSCASVIWCSDFVQPSTFPPPVFLITIDNYVHKIEEQPFVAIESLRKTYRLVTRNCRFTSAIM